LIVAWAARQGHAAVTAAAVSGTVRDLHGTPQMGTLIELLTPDATVIGSASSDQHGRYIIPTVAPGRYELRATAAFFAPVLRTNLRLQAGTQSIVNLTMTAMFEAESWLPAQRRHADEPVDDWKWTLRSTAARPLLRLVDEDGVAISSSGEQQRRMVSEGRVLVTNGDGTFGGGGMHQALLLDRSLEDGDSMALRAEVGDAQSPYAPGPSVVLGTGYERSTLFGGGTRLVSSFQSHPELTNGVASTGFQVMQVAGTQQITLGDMVMIDAGTLLEAERLEATRLEAEPFLGVTGRPTDDLAVEYRFATGRQVQSPADLDSLKPVLTALTDASGRPLSTRGSHQEVSVSRRLPGGRLLSVAVYRDGFAHGAVAGIGLMDRGTLAQALVVADPTTGTFELGTVAYHGRGLSVTAMQPLTAALSAWAEYDLGTALRNTGGVCSLANLAANVAPHTTPAASLALRGRLLRSGTALKAEYRWQRLSTLSQVNAYNVAPNAAYLSFYVRQRVWAGRLLPQGMDAVVEATNLLEQGYQPVLAPDGQTLFLAQVSRAVQGGLAFNF
jgi:hypothetical protein